MSYPSGWIFIARLVSYLFHPLLVGVYMAAYMIFINPVYYNYVDPREKILSLATVFNNNFVFPLEVARALATRPRLLLLDEPAAGLNPQETLELMDFLRDIRARHRLTLLIIEHNLRLVMHLCEHLTVLDHGLTIASGPPPEVQKNPQVIKAYLGK